METVKFRLELVDGMIHYWRGRRDEAGNAHDELIASCHVEAFQLARILHGFPLLSEDG